MKEKKMRKPKETFNIGRSKNIVIFAGELGYSWEDYKKNNPKLMGILDYLRVDFIYDKTDLLLIIFDDQISGTHIPTTATYTFSKKKVDFNPGLELRKTINWSVMWEEVLTVYEEWAKGLTFPYATVDPKEVVLAKGSRE